MGAIHVGLSPPHPWRSDVRPPIPCSSGKPVQQPPLRSSPLLSTSLLSTRSPTSISHPCKQSAVARRAPANPPAALESSDSVSGRHTWPQAAWKYYVSLPDLGFSCVGSPSGRLWVEASTAPAPSKWDQQPLPVVQPPRSPRREFLGDLSGLLCFQIVFICFFRVLLSQVRDLNSTG